MKISDVRVSYEAKRGCGFRKPGRLYLVGPELSNPCGKLPLLIDKCRACGEGFGFSRAPKWIDPIALFQKHNDTRICLSMTDCTHCPAAHPELMGDAAVLIWIGRKHYPTPQEFTQEATHLGVSRYIKSVPRGFQVGETWVLLAHLNAERQVCECFTTREPGYTMPDCEHCKGSGLIDRAGIFTMFRPTKIEYVCRGDETEEELDALLKRDLTPVIVKKIEEAQSSIEE